ncbi:ABC transporter permease [Stenotrophomonas maltophilia]|nr:ABC transporter permease [Stenotrophomonas maltophilia]MBN4961114.1 ABC transporter permease [Stenotrophomonas maltophilia]
MRASGQWLSETVQSWRAMLRRPGYLIVGSLTLALGIAATTAAFSMIDQAFLRPLPFPQSSDLVTLGMQGDDDQATNIGSPAFYTAVGQSPIFASVGIIQAASRQKNVAFGDSVQVSPSLAADEGFLRSLGLRPVLGRNFNQEESRPGGPSAALITYDFWQRTFGGAEDVLGRSLQVEGKPVPVVGVLPNSLSWPTPFDLILPMQLDPADRSTSTNEFIVARLKHDATLAQASAAADGLMRPILNSQAASDSDRQAISRIRFNAIGLKDSIFASHSSGNLWLFMAAAICVLAISAFNLGNLMIVRNLSRGQDQAIRAALGASGWRLAVPSLGEAALVSLLGTTLGIVIAAIGLRLLGQWIPSEWLRGQVPSLGLTSILFAFIAGAAMSAAGALLGTWRGRDSSSLAMLGRKNAGVGRATGRLTKGLIIGQVAVATALLLCASLFSQSLDRLSKVPMGFSSQQLVTFSLAPVQEAFPGIADVLSQTRKLQSALAESPAVQGAADVTASTNLPTASQFNMYAEFPDGRGASVQFRPVTPEYFSVFNIPIITGQGLSQAGRPAGAVEAVVSETFAKSYLEGNPIGQIIEVAGGDTVRVAGVVGDVRQFGPREDAPPVLYVSIAQLSPDLWLLLRDYMPLRYAVRVAPGSELQFANSLQELVRAEFSGQPISDVRTMTQVVRSMTSDQRLTLTLVSLFSGLALLLAGVGLYAVMSVAVASRIHEFGVRAAMGASPAVLVRQVVSEGVKQTGVGLLIGIALAASFSRIIQRYLFGVEVANMSALFMVICALLLAGVAASAGPALMASRVQPMQALREQ